MRKMSEWDQETVKLYQSNDGKFECGVKGIGYGWKIVGEIDQSGSGELGHQCTVSLQLKYTTEVRRG